MNIFRQLIFCGGLGGGGGGGRRVNIRKKFRNRLDPVTFYEFIVESAYGVRDIVVTTSVGVCASVRLDLSGH